MNFLSRLLAAALMIVGLIPLGPHDARAATDKPTLLGFATRGFEEAIPAFRAEASRAPAILQRYWELEHDWPNGWAPANLTAIADLGMIAYVEVTTSDLGALNRGDKDTTLHSMAKTVGDWIKEAAGRRILIAPLPEMNLSGHPWGGDPSGYKAGYTRIRQAFLDQGLTESQIRFVFAPNGLGEDDYDDYYPGDETVDLIGFAKVNKGDPWRDYDRTFQMHIDEMRSRVSLAKPILITQTASVDKDGARDQWLTDMFNGLKAHDQVIGAVYFNRDKDFDYRVLVDGQLDDTFIQGYSAWSDPSQSSWIFDGRMDEWVSDREQRLGSGFLDEDGHTFEDDIAWLADQGITKGCNPPLNTLFCPDDFVTRGQMAAFLVRAFDYTDNGGGDLFIDDNASSFEKDIDKLATAGVTKGCNPPNNDRYCPDDFVTRGEMAAFLRRALAS